MASHVQQELAQATHGPISEPEPTHPQKESSQRKPNMPSLGEGSSGRVLDASNSVLHEDLCKKLYVSTGAPRQDMLACSTAPASMSKHNIQDSARSSAASTDAYLLTPFRSNPSSPSMEPMSDTDNHRYSTAESFDTSVLATPGTPGLRRSSSSSAMSPLYCPDNSAHADGKRRTGWPRSPVESEAAPYSDIKRQASPHGVIPSAPATPSSRATHSSYNTPSSSTSAADFNPSRPSTPSIRFSQAVRGVPRVSFTRNNSSHLVLPPGAAAGAERAPSPSAESFRSPLETPASSPRTVVPKSTGSSPSEPTPVSRRRRLHALRSLVANLDFAQPWSVVERSEVEPNEDECFWPYPGDPSTQQDRISHGVAFDSNGVPVQVNDSSISLPRSAPVDPSNSTWPRSRRHSRSLVSLAEHSALEPVTPKSPASQARAVLSAVSKKDDILATYPSVLRRAASTHAQESPRSRPMGMIHEVPRPRSHRGPPAVASSGYSRSIQKPPSRRRTQPTSWRASLPNDRIYEQIAKAPDGAVQVQRQEIMWEMCETEAAFVGTCEDVVRLFASPLRDAQGKWMQGLPDGVCELFEALESILEAHRSIVVVQDKARRETGVMGVEEFVQQLRDWVPSLQCHERYIMLFNTVVAQIDVAVRDSKSIFGEFLRLQTRDNALGSLSLGSTLLKPVQRLTKYTLFLRRLLAATPEPHHVRSSLVELINATETIIGDLEDCKAREDDYIQLQAIEESLDDLPEGFKLAVRNRRLVAHAQVSRVSPEPPTPLSSRSTSLRSLRASLSSTVASVRAPQGPIPSSSGGASRSTSRSSDIELPPLPQRRPGSTSASSSSTLHSIPSGSELRAPISRDGALTPSPTYTSFTDNARPPAKTALRKGRREDVLTLLVFNDMVVLAAPVTERSAFFKSRKADKADSPRLRVLPASEGGIGSVSDVQESPGYGGHDHAFVLSTRSPYGVSAVLPYALSPTSPKVQVANGVRGRGLDKIEHVVAAMALARREAARARGG